MQSIQNFKTSVICLIINFLVLTELYIAFIRFKFFQRTRRPRDGDFRSVLRVEAKATVSCRASLPTRSRRNGRKDAPAGCKRKRPSVQAGATEYPFSSVWSVKIRAHLAPFLHDLDCGDLEYLYCLGISDFRLFHHVAANGMPLLAHAI